MSLSKGDRNGQTMSKDRKRIPEARVVFVHGIGEKRDIAKAELSWSTKSVERLCSWLCGLTSVATKKIKFTVVPCAKSCIENSAHRHVEATEQNRIVGKWSLIAICWAPKIIVPKLRDFLRWLVNVLIVLGLWHAYSAVVDLKDKQRYAMGLLKTWRPDRITWALLLQARLLAAGVWSALWRTFVVLAFLVLAAIAAIAGIWKRPRRFILNFPLLDSYAWVADEKTRQGIHDQVAGAIFPQPSSRQSVDTTTVVAHSQGCAVATAIVNAHVEEFAEGRGVPQLLCLGSGSGLLGLLSIAHNNRSVRRRGTSIAILGVVATLFLAPEAAYVLLGTYRGFLNLVTHLGSDIFAVSISRQYPITAHEIVSANETQGRGATFHELINNAVLLYPLSAVAVLLLALMISILQGLELEELALQWRSAASPLPKVGWTDVHTPFDFVSSSQPLLHGVDDSKLVIVGQSATFTDHVRYFKNRSSVLPLILAGMLLPFNKELARNVRTAGTTAGLLTRHAVASAVTMRRLMLLVAVILGWQNRIAGLVLAIAAIGFARIRIWRAQKRYASKVISRPAFLLNQENRLGVWRYSFAAESFLLFGILMMGIGMAFDTMKVPVVIGESHATRNLHGDALWIFLVGVFWIATWDVVRRGDERARWFVPVALLSALGLAGTIRYSGLSVALILATAITLITFARRWYTARDAVG